MRKHIEDKNVRHTLDAAKWAKCCNALKDESITNEEFDYEDPYDGLLGSVYIGDVCVDICIAADPDVLETEEPVRPHDVRIIPYAFCPHDAEFDDCEDKVFRERHIQAPYLRDSAGHIWDFYIDAIDIEDFPRGEDLCKMTFDEFVGYAVDVIEKCTDKGIRKHREADSGFWQEVDRAANS